MASQIELFARRYGGRCLICGVVRDYHGFTPKDHAFAPRLEHRKKLSRAQ